MKYKINKGFIMQKLDNKIIIFNDKKSILYTFNETASYMFDKIKKGWPEDKIIKKTLSAYQVKEKQISKDFNNLLKMLKRAKIILP